MQELGLSLIHVVLVLVNFRAFQLLFNWFIPLAFPGVQPVSYWLAAGLTWPIVYALSSIRHSLDHLCDEASKSPSEKAQASLLQTLKLWLVVGLYWLVKSYCL